MLGLILYLTGLLIAIGCGVLASVSDVRGMKIPNLYPAAIIGAFIISFSGTIIGDYTASFSTLLAHIFSGGLILIFTVLLYISIRFGAGDSKLWSAYALWFPPHLLVPFLFAVSLAGALLSLTAFIIQKKKPFNNPTVGSWLERLQKGANAVPYGVAIVCGAVITFIWQGFFNLHVLACFIETSCL